MPLVAHTPLPSFERLRHEGQKILPPDYARHQDIRELHIGLLNMMPDKALEATERQFFRLLGACNQIVQFYVHPFTIEGLERSPEARAHIERFYEPFDKIREEGLDALIVSGANVTHPNIAQEPFWEPLTQVFDWAKQNVTSILCSCLATHALVQYCHGIQRTRLPEKRWGVYPHRVVEPRHPLVADINTRFDVPHSRYNELFAKDLKRKGLKVLVESEVAGVHLAVSQDLLRVVYFQGHPEYDTISLMKEYKREILRFYFGEREDYPPFPENYFAPKAQELLQAYRLEIESAKRSGRPPADFPEQRLIPLLDNTWRDTAKAVFNNWLGLVYQFTHQDRRIPFMPGVDPQNPLGLVLEN
ncbi:MAG: homoserine O-succinyltransferase [Methylothermaceae bacteria B42]|nr:MAG: homoserine O-succinyltransferase [Methylothermaceae bacteria B42]HHJ38106.1 homoserine O-succinyltransferase [Methylothermaceae bacterium]